MRACQGKSLDGQPCRAPARETGFCFAHDPDLAETRQLAKRKGGKARHGRQLGPLLPEGVPGVQIAAGATLSLEDVARLISGEIATVLTMEKSHARARSLGYLAEKLIKLHEVGELADRLDSLEGMLLTRGSGERVN